MKILLFQIDGKLPNIALMRIAAHHRAMGDSVELRDGSTSKGLERWLWDDFGRVYGSAIFEKSRPRVKRLLREWPEAVVGGTGIDLATTLECHGITTKVQDYSIYPEWRQSIGFSQRGCRLRCPFCVVPEKEGAVSEENTIADLWRGDPWPREVILLDNDFFGQKAWPERIEEMRAGKFRVSFSQGINARVLTDETAAAVASVDYRSTHMTKRRLYTAWDNRKDEARLFRGLELLTKHGIRPSAIMVYVLIGYDHASKSARPFLTDDDFHRRQRLREFGAEPYPMPFVRTRELVGYQRWVVGAYDKRISWPDWVAADYEPRKLGESSPPPPET